MGESLAFLHPSHMAVQYSVHPHGGEGVCNDAQQCKENSCITI